MADIEDADGRLPVVGKHQGQGRGGKDTKGDRQQYDNRAQLHERNYSDVEDPVNVKFWF
jgi:hypothetical protein